LMPSARVITAPTRADVIEALPRHAIAHFACHGYANWDTPAASTLILPDFGVAPLTVADIGALELTGSLAYLSACDTTVTAPALADEAIHITGAFHLAGYQNVIGTLWPITSTMATQITLDVYRTITRHGTTDPEPRLAAGALHDATRRVRNRYPRTPTLWAAHLHTGT